LLLNAQGNVAAQAVYYPFGLTRYEQNGSQVHYRFTGHEQDASGLLYANARYYEPVTGRFISVDPLYVESPLKGIKNPQLLNLYAYALNNPGRYTDPDGTEPKATEQQSMKSLQGWAGLMLQSADRWGYDPDKLLSNPRLSPEMVWQLRNSMSYYYQDEGLMAGTNGDTGPGDTTVRVVRSFDNSDRGSIYDLGVGADVKLYDKEGRYMDPRTIAGTAAYGLFMKGAQKVGFSASVVTPEEGQSYIRLQYTPNYPGYQNHEGKLATAREVNYNLKKMGWNMQDLRKHVWRQAHGSYWRYRYALAHPIRPK
jgi:RHS repeat-associated protein